MGRRLKQAEVAHESPTPSGSCPTALSRTAHPTTAASTWSGPATHAPYSWTNPDYRRPVLLAGPSPWSPSPWTDRPTSPTDPDALRRVLTWGIGRARAYGCGVLTPAPHTPVTQTTA
ncbi:type I-E CRISPR-associated protein Cas6/Cse3/CasE [Streptomyces sp. NPDC048208]|uniref:type I-E CRISPR-associated protein Cas6/Cse3/CasE n=1 Tax=Streptomyces sp. NPDC048208 TaxID=3365515 RepID=UPI0037212818